MEIWRDIEGYEGLYQISNLGRVKSLERKVNANFINGKEHIYKEKILNPFKEVRGYLKVRLCKNGTTKNFKVHRLVASAFLGKSNLTVNHIDENKQNNKLDNLEYMTNKDNVRFSQAKRVKATNIITGEYLEFDSTQEAKKMGFNHVSDCCLGKRKTDKGYKWEYIKED